MSIYHYLTVPADDQHLVSVFSSEAINDAQRQWRYLTISDRHVIMQMFADAGMARRVAGVLVAEKAEEPGRDWFPILFIDKEDPDETSTFRKLVDNNPIEPEFLLILVSNFWYIFYDWFDDMTGQVADAATEEEGIAIMANFNKRFRIPTTEELLPLRGQDYFSAALRQLMGAPESDPDRFPLSSLAF